jgi:hypothetical protein
MGERPRPPDANAGVLPEPSGRALRDVLGRLRRSHLPLRVRSSSATSMQFTAITNRGCRCWKLVAAGAPLRTLALNVAAMNAVDPLTGLSACDTILASTSLREIVTALLRAEAFRPMCRNCAHLREAIAADIVDCACPDFWPHWVHA